MYSPISPELLDRFERDFEGDPVNSIRMHAVVKHGVSDAAENHLEDVLHPMIFSVELESGKITDQKQSGRCWLFAGLNTMRFEIMKKLNLKTFELSQNYQMFYDKLEKANYFLESVIKTSGRAAGRAAGQLSPAEPDAGRRPVGHVRRADRKVRLRAQVRDAGDLSLVQHGGHGAAAHHEAPGGRADPPGGDGRQAGA